MSELTEKIVQFVLIGREVAAAESGQCWGGAGVTMSRVTRHTCHVSRGGGGGTSHHHLWRHLRVPNIKQLGAGGDTWREIITIIHYSGEARLSLTLHLII